MACTEAGGAPQRFRVGANDSMGEAVTITTLRACRGVGINRTRARPATASRECHASAPMSRSAERTWPCAARGNRIVLSEPIDLLMVFDKPPAKVRACMDHRVVHAIAEVGDVLETIR